MDISDFAALAVNKLGVRGIDWVALGQQGRGSVWVRDYMTQYMQPAQAQMNGVVGTLDVDPTGGNADVFQRSFVESHGAVDTVAQGFGSLVGINLDVTKIAFAANQEAIRSLISHAYAAATFGARTHYDETIHHSGISDAEIATHANLCVAMMNSVVLLDTLGVYAAYRIKHDFSTNGLGRSALGVLPAVAWVAISIAGMCVIAYVIISLTSVSKTNHIVSTMCTNAQAAGDVATTQQCINTLTDPTKNAGTQIPDMLGSAFKAVLPYALGALAIYALFLSAPAIIKTITKTKAA